MTVNVFIGIDYDEGVPGTYRAVTVEVPGLEERRFDTGHPPFDYKAAMVFARSQAQALNVVLMERSCVHHFSQDDPEFYFGPTGALMRADPKHYEAILAEAAGAKTADELRDVLDLLYVRLRADPLAPTSAVKVLGQIIASTAWSE